MLYVHFAKMMDRNIRGRQFKKQQEPYQLNTFLSIVYGKLYEALVIF